MQRDFHCKRGDVLLYPWLDRRKITEDAVSLGEFLEDGPQERYYYHVALALDDTKKIEADGRFVAIHNIDYGLPDVFRPPATRAPRAIAAKAVAQIVSMYLGQRYDWWLIFDDGLRALSRGHIHLPVGFINSRERHSKICSSLVETYLKLIGIEMKKRPWARATPQDIRLSLRDTWLVSRGKG